ncbi:CwfJ C-terminus 1-domain-containing protein-like protein [Phakopsora pachyrhizi]|uniref:CwfJ C-terminus 1-domain-containing protein-like protein n=1 Tax=Phakopsora pachyrhizi TaxID=170000 RepID=A0AAV0AFQ6_PHAPC|nr:CwfJ C-terminus 1-domain-containing protein-like protein [Phakopsora pachyrhizi]CAH7666090.1 CwfJ C-terminus 1-domain-containing protein-like protein [Phakopsora pachyrhizi]
MRTKTSEQNHQKRSRQTSDSKPSTSPNPNSPDSNRSKQRKVKNEEEVVDEDEWVEKEPSRQADLDSLNSLKGDQRSDRNDKNQSSEIEPSKDDDEGDRFFNSLGTQLRGQAIRDSKIQHNLAQEEKKRFSSSIKRLGAGDPNYRPDDDSPTIFQKPTPGGPGYQWRLIKLKRTYETAAEENRPVKEVAAERYGSLEEWEDAIEERKLVEEQQQTKRFGSTAGSERNTPRKTQKESYGSKYLFNNEDSYSSRPGSSSGFRRPTSNVSTPDGGAKRKDGGSNTKPITRMDQLKNESGSLPASPSASTPSTPIPSVINPLASQASGLTKPSHNTSASLLNKLQARLMKAKLMDPSAVPELEKQYQDALEAQKSTNTSQVEMVPLIDGRGRMYDVGSGNHQSEEEQHLKPGNRKSKSAKFETRDPKTGDLVRLNEDDDKLSLDDLVRQEKFKGKSLDQKNMDFEMAKRIMGDQKFENNLDYIDDNADRLAKKSMKNDSAKRLFAINDYARTKKSLENCKLCFDDNGSAPDDQPIISIGTKVYLSCPHFEELVEGHCWIVPIQHSLCSLEADEDVWDEIKNYMKCLMRMFLEQKDSGVLFYETVLSFKHQRHTYIEAVPVPWDLFSDAPAYFKESIMSSESEWSQSKKLIDFSTRPGGFRRSMVPNLPYFMVQWDYKGEKGLGHVIEGNEESSGRQSKGKNEERDESSIIDEGGGGSQFPRYFAAEIIGNILEVEPRLWRRPKRLPSKLNRSRVNHFLDNVGYRKYDWTQTIITFS